MENKNNENISYINNVKSELLNGKDKERRQSPSNQSTNSKMLKNLGIISSPSSIISRNNDNNISSIKKMNEKEKNKSISNIKLIKNANINYPILQRIITNQNISSKKTCLNCVVSKKIFSKKLFKNNFSKNKITINSNKQILKDGKNKIRKISTAFLLSRSSNLTDINENNKKGNKKENKKNKNSNNKNIIKNKIIRKNYFNEYNYIYNNFYRIAKEKMFYSPQKIMNKNINNNKTLIDDFLNSKYGIFNLSDFNRKLFSKNIGNVKPINKKGNKKCIINKLKNQNLFSELKKENDLMKKDIKKDYNSFNEFKKQYYSEKPNENTYEGFSKIYNKYNKDRSKKGNICINRIITLNWAGDKSLQNIDYKEKEEKKNKTKLNNVFLNSKGLQMFYDDENYKNKILNHQELSNLCCRANHQVEKKFPDLLSFNLPKVFHNNKAYTIKLLYDVFIEFKTLLKFCILFNRDINIHNKGIDFQTFFNCNTKINQQGEGLSKKIFKTLNNKMEKKYMPWGNYIDGMMKMKDPDMNHKMDLFFQILDENGDGSLDYNEVYNLSLVSLQRTLSQNPSEILKKNEKEKRNQKEVIEILAEFFSNMIFSLVNINVKDEIPIDILRKKMEEGGEASEYLEMFLCADNFA